VPWTITNAALTEKRNRKNLVELNTTVKNKKTGHTRTYSNNTDISLDDMNGQDFVVISRARYNTTTVEGTACTHVENKVEGSMVTLYQTNPNEKQTSCT